ncbi:MAG: epoxyqueuosine reductase QueH [Desulfobacteraceae bacterium]|nr:epoxyqueuosine reductase QueH [Desulfobacteraceae bacterium]
MKLLLHICCAPCSIYPLEVLREKGFEVMGFFYRNNIHPYNECKRREDALKAYAEQIGLRVIYQEGYDLEGFLRSLVFREDQRCRFCYYDRLKTSAKMAKRGKFDYFSSTLLYSRHQNHELIAEIGESVAKTEGVTFYYEDFRKGWKTGVEKSKQMGMYRQQYCGCIYSEKERFFSANG